MSIVFSRIHKLPHIAHKLQHRRLTKSIMIPEPISNNKSLHFSTDSYETYVNASFCEERLRQNKATVARSTDITVDKETLLELLKTHYVICDPDGKTSFGTARNNETHIDIHNKRWNTKVTIIGDQSQVEKHIKLLESTFPSNPCYVRWVYDPNYLEDVMLPVNHDQLPVQEMYPFIQDESLTQYYDRFIKSSANILVLIGAPGTGKTSFIRGMLAHTRRSATLTYHNKVLEQDAFFVNWIQSEDTFMILEDSDSLLLPRTDGNDIMARFLNMGDGLISLKNKKIIFSTNLPNVSDIDEALTRPGRCFDILEFAQLNRTQAQALGEKIGIEVPDKNSLSISEIFAATKNEVQASRKTRFGFI